MRPDYISNEDISRWHKCIENDPNIPKELLQIPIILEVCYSGIWLSEELEKLNCPLDLISRIQFSAGRASFGRDCWKIHELFLNNYKNGQMDLETNSNLN